MALVVSPTLRGLWTYRISSCVAVESKVAGGTRCFSGVV